MMDLNEYQREIPKLASIPKDVPTLFYCAACMCEEAGEVLEVTIRLTEEETLLCDHPDLIKELGDVLWYLTMAATSQAFPINTLLEDLEHLEGEPEWPGFYAGSSRYYFATQLGYRASKVMGLVKKHYRDRHVEGYEDLDYRALHNALRATLATLSFTGKLSGISLETIAETNYNKIVDRVKRGTFHGTGSNR